MDSIPHKQAPPDRVLRIPVMIHRLQTKDVFENLCPGLFFFCKRSLIKALIFAMAPPNIGRS